MQPLLQHGGLFKASLHKTVFQGTFLKCWCKRAGLAASSLLPASRLGGSTDFCFAALTWVLRSLRLG